MSLDLLANYGALAAAAVAVAAYAWSRRRRPEAPQADGKTQRRATEESEVNLKAEQRVARALALDAISEAVLIVDEEGRVRDCNSAALALFQRHRASVQEVFVSTLRTLDDVPMDAHKIARERGVWSGESWARLPDGSSVLCLTRVVPLRELHGRMTTFAESYRDVVSEQLTSRELRDRLFGVRQSLGSPGDSLPASVSLARLGATFRDLEVAVQQYERVIDALSVKDPVTESIAGLVHDAREATSSIATRTLLHDIPELLAALQRDLGKANGARARH